MTFHRTIVMIKSEIQCRLKITLTIKLLTACFLVLENASFYFGV